MKVYVVRHGESETNLSKCWTGWLDVHLTEKGIADGQKAGKVLEGVVFDKVFSSDLIRAQETARAALPGCSYETTPLLREINVGSIAGKPWSIVTDEQRERNAQYGYTDFDGESKDEFFSRIRRFMTQLEELDCENVAVFSHAGWLCSLLETVLGVDIPRKRIYCGNCAVSVYECVDRSWRLHSWINVS